jgi:long-chain acyl-CoA synthetase
MIMYTSGTTGTPKGALSTQRAICQAIMNFDCAAMASAMVNPEAIGAMMKKGFAPAQMLAVPLFHVSGCHAVFLTALRAGRRIVMLYKWDVARALQLIESERVTVLSAAPGMLTELLESPLFAQTDTSSLFGLGGGGAATAPRTARLLMERVPDAYPGTGWGMTETNAIGSSFTGTPFREKPASAGFLHPVVELDIRDEEGHSVATGSAGRLWIRTPTLVSGYWNRPEVNAAEFRDGWFDSGDIGYLDAEGYLFLSDRAKDMVIRGGENIYPAEIEAVLMECPGIAEVAVFGIPDETLGEQLAAAVHASDRHIDAAAIRDFAAERLAHFKVPQVVWLHETPLPRNAAGKILKQELKVASTAAACRNAGH